METVKINFNTDKETKQAAEELFTQLGISMAAAVNMFLKRCILENGIPFDVSLNKLGHDTAEALKELKNMKDDPDKYKGYRDIDR